MSWIGVVGRETEVSDSESKKIHALAGVAPPLRELVYCAVCSCMYMPVGSQSVMCTRINRFTGVPLAEIREFWN